MSSLTPVAQEFSSTVAISARELSRACLLSGSFARETRVMSLGSRWLLLLLSRVTVGLPQVGHAQSRPPRKRAVSLLVVERRRVSARVSSILLLLLFFVHAGDTKKENV